MIKIILVNNNIREKEEISSIVSSHNDLVIQGLGNDNYDAITLVRKYKPDIIMLDAALVLNDGMEICGALKRYSPATAIVVFCSVVKDFLIKGIVNGILTDCIIKDTDMAQLVKILRKIHTGEHYVNSKVIARAFQLLADYINGNTSARFITEEKNSTFTADFSNSELDVLRLITRGHNNKEIAKSLYLKDGTVRNYTSSIMQKAGVTSRSQIILYAQQCGLAKSGRKPNTEAKLTCRKGQ